MLSNWHCSSRFEWSPLWILPKFSVIPPFWALSYDWSPLCSPKNQVIPPKILRPPQVINNDRSLNNWLQVIRLTFLRHRIEHKRALNLSPSFKPVLLFPSSLTPNSKSPKNNNNKNRTTEIQNFRAQSKHTCEFSFALSVEVQSIQLVCLNIDKLRHSLE